MFFIQCLIFQPSKAVNISQTRPCCSQRCALLFNDPFSFKWGVLLSVRHLLYASLGRGQKVLLCYIKVAISLSGFLLLAWRGTVASSAG
jgi:hypothetical protein